MSATYEIRLRGRVTDWLLSEFEGMTATTEPGATVLRGPLPDQAALHGLLERVQALGLELIEVRRLSDGPRRGITRSG